ncbi:hypothetical protein RGQ21_01990 [Kitasatospora aureofaciens]|nr:hypothetical protein RGQ21_01990 [Kitasatospora aureofaciens]
MLEGRRRGADSGSSRCRREQCGLGRLRLEKDVDAGEWFYETHFFQTRCSRWAVAEATL